MKPIRILMNLLMVVGLAACGQLRSGAPADSLQDAAPAPTEAPAAASGKLTTTAGEFAIVGARFVAEANGTRPQPGERLLLVMLARPDRTPLTPADFSLEAFQQAVQDPGAGGVYLLGADGARAITTMAGWVADEFAMGFRVPEGTGAVTLYWPGNDPIALTPAE